MNRPLNFLMLEDDPNDAELVISALRQAGFDPVWKRVDSEGDYLDQLLCPDFDIILSDYQMPQFNGLRALELLNERGIDIPFIIVSGTIDEETAVEAMKHGAADYLLKDRLARLGPAITHALEQKRLQQKRKQSLEELRLRERALGAVSQGVLISDENRLIIYANASFTTLTGYAEADILGQSCALLQGSETDPETILKIRSALNEGKSFDGEILNYRKDGTKFWNELSLTPIRVEKGGSIRFIGIQRDVTARKLAQEALQKSEQHICRERALLRGLIDSIPDLVFFKDKESVFLGCNKAFETHIGTREEKLIGLTDFDIVNAELATSYREIDHEMIVSGRTQRTEDWIPSADGGGGQFETVKTPYYGPNGESLGLIGVSRDITERKEHEAQMDRLRIEHEIVLNSLGEGVHWVGTDGRIRFENPAAAKMLGYEVSELIGKPAHVTMHHTRADGTPYSQNECPIYATLKDAVVRRISDEVFCRKDGTSFAVEYVCTPVYEKDGSPGGSVVIFSNVTERKRMEQALGLALERLQLSLKAGKIGTWDLDLRTYKLHWDDQILALYGMSGANAETDFERWFSALHPADVARTKELHESVLEGEKDSFETEFRIFREDDRCLRFIHAMGVLVRGESGSPARLIGINWDVTEERLHEKQLSEALAQEKELSEKARAGERAKSEFLAVMSHEVRTPLNGILGFAELLAQAPTLAGEYKNYSQIIVQSGEALLRILDDILDFSRLEAGRLQIESIPFSPRKMLEDIYNLLGRQASEKNLGLHLSVDSSIPEHLNGDAGRLRQVLLNLVGNAIKFTETGSVSVNLKPLEGQSETFEFSVKDTGPGISPQHIHQIFQPFTQADSSISRRYGGTGLGLAISKRLTELLGGRLGVQSQIGEGSEFSFAVPLGIVRLHARSPSAPPSSLDISFAARHPLRLLLVEDDRVNLKLVQTLVRRLGFESFVAKNGREAVEMYCRELPNCVLMDLQMPEMDGIEATERIRSFEKSSGQGTQAFISALTANIFPADRQRCLGAGMDGYLNKPIKITALAEMLIKAADKIAESVA